MHIDFSLDDIIKELGLAYIFRKKSKIIDDTVLEYYEVLGADLGFRMGECFISLSQNVGEIYNLGNDLESTQFAYDFNAFSYLCLKYGYDAERFLKKYSFMANKFYIWDFDEKKFKEILDKNILSIISQNSEDLDILRMYDKITDTIIAQDGPVKQILTSIYKNQKIINSSLDSDTIAKLKENIIVYGSTGTGKTEMLTQMAKLYDVPIVIEDITAFTESGYVGRDVSEMLHDLFLAADEDIERAEKGILVIDEFDKLAENGFTGDGDGPSRSGVQRSLLKILDGGTISFRDGDDGDLIKFDTSRLTIVALGAFSDIKKDDDYSDISIKDFTNYGIKREVMGRFSKLVAMKHFSYDDYRRILLESNLSPINTYKKFFESLGVRFSYDDDLIDYIINEVIALDCGARGLKTVFDGIINDYLFDVFSNDFSEIHLSVPKDKSKSYVARKKASDIRRRRTIGFGLS